MNGKGKEKKKKTGSVKEDKKQYRGIQKRHEGCKLKNKIKTELHETNYEDYLTYRQSNSHRDRKTGRLTDIETDRACQGHTHSHTLFFLFVTAE